MQLQAPNVDTIVIPKVNSASDMHFVTDVVRHALPERHTASSTKFEVRAERKYLRNK